MQLGLLPLSALLLLCQHRKQHLWLGQVLQLLLLCLCM